MKHPVEIDVLNRPVVNTMSLSGFSSIWPRDLAFHVSLELRRDSW